MAEDLTGKNVDEMSVQERVRYWTTLVTDGVDVPGYKVSKVEESDGGAKLHVILERKSADDI